MHRRPDLYSRWAREVRARQFFRPGLRVGVGVSGGPDSVLLLHFMNRLAGELGMTVAAVHFNHHLRGAESDGDEYSVRDLAAELKVPYLRGEADVGRLARERHANIEATARELRYRYFFSLVEQDQLDLVATAHTANDQAETVLMRMIRGTGTRGLGGIYPELEGKVVRPFLTLTRDEIMQEIAAQGISYRVDSTNLLPRLRRNKVRMELLPMLAKDYNPQIVTLLNQFADRARDDEACLERMARDRSMHWRVREDREERIPIRALEEFPPALARRVLRQMLQFASGRTQGLTHAHIESLRQFATKAQSGKICELPGGVTARKEFSWLVISPEGNKSGTEDFSYAIEIPRDVAVHALGKMFHLKILPRDAARTAYNQRKLVCLDPEKLCGNLELRNWRAGDSFCPVGTRKARKLKEFFCERKVPESRRKSWPVLSCSGQIVWARGFPPAKSAAADEKSPQVLVIEEEPLKIASFEGKGSAH
jgi:tRNA(Ile)-lysidine synthase